MGHIELLACDLDTKLLFLHKGGGSNGYEREFNEKNIIENGSKGYQQFSFDEWVSDIDI
jgi:hypothetical protein